MRRLAVLAMLAAVCGAAFLLSACADDSTPSAGRATENAPLSETEFIAQADRICADVGSRFAELEDPDGEGGAKPIGIGALNRDWVSELRALAPPSAVADDWTAALDLLAESADKLDQAEGGDEGAQSEALFDLQARAQEHIDAMQMPFQGCFVE